MQYSIRFGISRRILYVNVPGLFASALPAAGAIRDSMARKASSSKPPAPKSGFRPTLERLKPSKPIQASEAASAAQQGMLQLTFARHAHGYGFLAAFAFVFNGLLVLIFSMGMTWQGLGARKLASIGAALILPVLMVLQNVTFFGQLSIITAGALFIGTYWIGALTTEIAGSLLHIIASSTSVYQREILKADNSKVAMVQQDYQKKREALDYKERALRGREAHLEALQQELEDQAKDLKTKLSEVTTREVSIEKGSTQL